MSILQQLEKYLERKELKELLDQEGFPIKLTVPLIYTIQATFQFKQFQFLEDHTYAQRANLYCLFKVPSDYEIVSRKEGMKMMKNRNKRLLFANISA